MGCLKYEKLKLSLLKSLLLSVGYHKHDERRLQSVVCFTQLNSGVDFGYAFTCGSKGPYSDELADEYYNLKKRYDLIDIVNLKPIITSSLLKSKIILESNQEHSIVNWCDWLAVGFYLKYVVKSKSITQDFESFGDQFVNKFGAIAKFL